VIRKSSGPLRHQDTPASGMGCLPIEETPRQKEGV